MKKSALLLLGIVFLSLITSAQTTTQASKECKISIGTGIAGATKNMKKAGPDYWFQLDYSLKDNFSIAFEFENSSYKQVGYFTDLPAKYDNEIAVVNNSFSFLVKYNFSLKSKLKLAIASGWTYNLRTSGYYEPPYDVSSQVWPQYITTLDDLRIPFLTEAQFPISRSFNLMARLKYNFNRQNGDTYSAGIGISLKL